MMKSDIKTSLYHSLLRISVCVLALALVFDSGLVFESTARISSDTQSYLANAVGVKVAVEPNDMNVLTARITELEQEIKVKDREIAVNLSNNEGGGTDRSTFVLSALLFILLLLIIINYILDYYRSGFVRSPSQVAVKG